jgi:glycosyltransferase involved in cell wall biosynthesis
MTILFDLSSTQPISGNDFHGGSEYAKTVFYALSESLPSGVSLEVFYNPAKNIDNTLLTLCAAKSFTVNHCRNNADISALLCEKKYHTVYSALPYAYGDLVIPAETKWVYTIHGLRPLEYPADIYALQYAKATVKSLIKHTLFLLFPSFWNYYRKARDTALFNRIFTRTQNQTIITVSNHSKFSIAYFFPHLDISRIKVLYSPAKSPAFDHGGGNTAMLDSLSLQPGKYILLIGGDRSEKGAYRACRVLHKLVQARRIPDDVTILVLGVSYRKPYATLTKNSSRFIFHRYVSAEDLEILYRNAGLFVYPTMNEGFGYPPLEAMKYGTLCACSANSAITEICADAVLYFNPHDETEMSIRILQSFDDHIRAEKAGKMAARYAQVSTQQEHDLRLLIQEIIA